MREEYKKELDELKTKMQKAEKFAKKFPMFEDTIINYKLTGDEDHVIMGYRYKDIDTPWGINRSFYRKDGRNDMLNYKKSDFYSGHFFVVYIDTFGLYDSYEEFGLYESLSHVDIFFTDKLNRTFYITDENIECFLDALNEWYLKAMKQVHSYNAEKKIRESEKKIREAQEIIEKQRQILNQGEV